MKKIAGNKNPKVPNLRFKEFDDYWKTKKLGEVAEINSPNKGLPEKFIYVDLESVKNGELIKAQKIYLSEAPSRAQRLLQKNDILFQMVRPYQKNNFFFDRNGSYVASTGYAQLRTKQHSKFIYHYLHYQKFVDKVIERCTGTSYPAINSTDLSNIQMEIPSLEEQQKISSFLSLLEDRIKTQNKIIEGLKLVKRSVTKKIFERKIKFKNHKKISYPEWQSKRLGDITSVVNKRNNRNEKLPVYSISNKFGFIPQSEQFEGIDSDNRGYDIKLYKVVDKETFAYNPARINVGSIGYSGSLHNIIISSLYVCFKTNSSVNDQFLLQYLKSDLFNREVLKHVEGGVRDYLFYENFAWIKINLPFIEEQQKIASFLSALDQKIELETTLLNLYTKQKQYLLQQMFI